MASWPIYQGTSEPHDSIAELPPAPNWRDFDRNGALLPPPAEAADPTTGRRLGGQGFLRPHTLDEIQMINAALYLRRPLLVTGPPGAGKSTLPYHVAYELRLGPVLRWPITSRSTLRDGLYRYDAIGRLRDENLRVLRKLDPSDDADIGKHLSLGPLGTALLPHERPRVLLIDEIDKCDIDLPNDLLNVFEEGQFTIDELARIETKQPIPVPTADSAGPPAPITGGQVACHAFPFIVLTSNGERDLPKAFLRRCLRLQVHAPNDDQISAMIAAHLDPEAADKAERHIHKFLTHSRRDDIAADQLLNAVFLAMSAGESSSIDDVVDQLIKPLTGLG